MRNFNTLMAVVGALTHTAISRLKKTMAMVPKDSLKVSIKLNITRSVVVINVLKN